MRRGLAAALALTAALLQSPIGAFPPQNPARCIANRTRPVCSFFAAGPVRYDAMHFGPWVVRVYRGTQLVFARGAQTPDSGFVPSVAGDRVEAALLNPGACSPPGELPPVQCPAGGAVVLSEGLLD